MAIDPVWTAYRGYAQSNPERLVNEALAADSRPAAELAWERPASRAHWPLNPPRFGLEHHAITIEDVVNTALPGIPQDDDYRKRVQDRRTYLSGGPADFTATARPSHDGWW